MTDSWYVFDDEQLICLLNAPGALPCIQELRPECIGPDGALNFDSLSYEERASLAENIFVKIADTVDLFQLESHPDEGDIEVLEYQGIYAIYCDRYGWLHGFGDESSARDYVTNLFKDN